MMDNLSRRVNQVSDKRDARNLFLLLEPLFQRLRSVGLSDPGLEISTTATLARNGNVFHYIAEGVKRTLAVNTNMPALVGTITDDHFNVFVFTADKNGNLFVQMGVEAETESGVTWPDLDQKRAIIGMIFVNPTLGNFVGGTTALSASGVNVSYLGTSSAYDPTTSI